MNIFSIQHNWRMSIGNEGLFFLLQCHGDTKKAKNSVPGGLLGLATGAV